MTPKLFPLARGVPMELLTERGLLRAFLQVVEEHRRDGRAVLTTHQGRAGSFPPEELVEEITAAQTRLTELNQKILRLQQHPAPLPG